jgi:putative chitinase
MSDTASGAPAADARPHAATAVITTEKLKAFAPSARDDLLAPLAAAFESRLPAAGIDTLLRRAHFLAQVAVESGGFHRLEENLHYSAGRIAAVWPRLTGRAAALAGNPEALANAAYAGRNGNRDEASADGWRYRGRGLIQLTGRANYLAAGDALGIPLIDYPDTAAEPETAVCIALWFWNARHCNGPADHDDADAVTRLINGPGMAAAAERRALVAKAKTIFV